VLVSVEERVGRRFRGMGLAGRMMWPRRRRREEEEEERQSCSISGRRIDLVLAAPESVPTQPAARPKPRCYLVNSDPTAAALVVGSHHLLPSERPVLQLSSLRYTPTLLDLPPSVLHRRLPAAAASAYPPNRFDRER